MKKIEIYREPKVFVFGNPCITEYTLEENELFFDKTINLSYIDELKLIESKISITNKFDYIHNNLDHVLETFKNNKVLMARITTSLAIALFLSSNPTNCFALSAMEKMTTTGANLVGILSIGINKGIMIMTVLRLFKEYTNGANNHRVFDILKESLALILSMILIPKLPIIVGTFFN